MHHPRPAAPAVDRQGGVSALLSVLTLAVCPLRYFSCASGARLGWRVAGDGRRSLRERDGCRLATRLPDSCHTLRHVSGPRCVWVGRILALRSDVQPPHALFICGPRAKSSPGRVVGFLCCVPTAKALSGPIVPRSSCVAPRFLDTGRTSHGLLRDPPHGCRKSW